MIRALGVVAWVVTMTVGGALVGALISNSLCDPAQEDFGSLGCANSVGGGLVFGGLAGLIASSWLALWWTSRHPR
jgi:hypothetical protein